MLIIENQEVVGVFAPISSKELGLLPLMHVSGIPYFEIDALKGTPFKASNGKEYSLRKRSEAEIQALPRYAKYLEKQGKEAEEKNAFASLVARVEILEGKML